MAKDIKETKKTPDEKKPEAKSGTASSCGCGCLLKTK